MNRKEVAQDEWLLRRSYCTPEKNYLNPDGTATSRSFKLRTKDNGELSVDVKSMTTPEKSVGDKTKYFLFEVSNEAVAQIGLKTLHDPLEDGSNDAHAVIVGMSIEDETFPGLLARSSRRVYF